MNEWPFNLLSTKINYGISTGLYLLLRPREVERNQLNVHRRITKAAGSQD